MPVNWQNQAEFFGLFDLELGSAPPTLKLRLTNVVEQISVGGGGLGGTYVL